jgi:hypothetical protein
MQSKIGKRRNKLPLRLPYSKAVENFKAKCLSRKDYDPAAVFVWGQMQAMALLELIKTIESRYGAEGQGIIRETINRVGKETFLEMAKGIEAPSDINDAELYSLILSWMNEVLYASIEDYFVNSPEDGGCQILYCPHQDTYKPFDCRIQRYFAEGIGQAAMEIWPDRKRFDSYFRQSIPQGCETCLFEFHVSKDKDDAWKKYTDELQDKALERLNKSKTGNKHDRPGK